MTQKGRNGDRTGQKKKTGGRKVEPYHILRLRTGIIGLPKRHTRNQRKFASENYHNHMTVVFILNVIVWYVHS